MEDNESSKNQYKITLKSLSRGEEFDDVILCSCIKAPFYKKASFWMLKINISALIAQQLLNELSSNTTRKFELNIYETKNDASMNNIPLQLVHKKTYKCVHAITADGGYKVNMEDQNCELIITLVDFILYDLFTKKSFNRKFDNITAFNVIVEEYEKKFLSDRYGKDTFKFNHVGFSDTNPPDEVNTFKHEELLVAAKNDLQVTDFLLYNKKATNTPSFYFFDDFHLSKDVKKTPITCHFVSLNDCQKFEKFDIRKAYDTLYASSILKEIPISDVFQNIIGGYDSIVIRSNNMIATRQDENRPLFHPRIIQFDSEKQKEYSINDDRKVNFVEVNDDDIIRENEGDISKSNDRQKHLVFYSQDDVTNTTERLKNYTVFIEGRIKQFVIVQIQDCFCDLMQFGKVYNFDANMGLEKSEDSSRPEKYVFVPIAIENIFYKDGDSKRVKHVVKTLMVEYYYNFSEGCEWCQYYDKTKKYCMLHLTAKELNSWCYDYEIPDE